MSEARTIWEEGHAPGHRVVALGLALTLTVVSIDLLAAGRVGLWFDLAFVLVCVALSLVVAPEDFFTVGVLPPLLMAAAFLILAATRPGAIAHPQDGVVQAVVTGLSSHAVPLGIGYALCLTCLAIRDRVLQSRRTDTRVS